MANLREVKSQSMPDISGRSKSYLSVEGHNAGGKAKTNVHSKSKDSLMSASGKSEKSGRTGSSGRRSDNFPPPIMDSENTVTELERYQASQICNRRGCWISMMILTLIFLMSGVITLTLWLQLATSELYWKEEFMPDWIFFDNPQYLAVIAAQPLFCSIWLLLILLCSIQKRGSCYRALRLYYVVAPYTIIPCCGFFLFYLFCLGWLEWILVYDHLERTLKQYSFDAQHEKVWDAVQTRFQCCGLSDGLWMEWLDNYHEEADLVKGYKIPASCCSGISSFTGCPKMNLDKFAYKRGCVDVIYEYYKFVGSSVTIAIGTNTIITSLTILFATRYYSLRRSMDNKEPHYYNVKIYTSEVFCVCCCCKRNAVGVSMENETQPRRKGYSEYKLQANSRVSQPKEAGKKETTANKID